MARSLSLRGPLLGLLLVLTLARTGSAAVGEWTSPGPDGGMVLTVAVDPTDSDIVYVGTFNGVFKSTDGGGSWASASRGLPGQAVRINDIAVSPSDPDVLYAGSEANGVFRSADSGETWTAVSAGLPGHIGAVEIDAANPDRVWAGVRSGVFFSTNGGKTWSRRGRGLSPGSDVVGLTFERSGGGWIYAATIHTVFRSANEGKLWTRVNSGLRNGSYVDIAVAPATPSVVFAGSGTGLYRSNDRGGSWTRLPSPAVESGIRALAFQGSRLLVAVNSTLLYSDDLGATFRTAHVPPAARITDLAAGAGLVYGAVADLQAGTVFRSKDHGNTWEEARTGIHSLAIDTVAVDPADADVLFAGGEAGLFRSADRGVSWSHVDLGATPNNVTRINTVLFGPADSALVFAGSGFGPGGLFRSQDGGETWQWLIEVPLMVEDLVADPRSEDAVWAAGYAGLYRTENGGDSWQRLPVPGADNVWVRDLEIDPRDPEVLWAAGAVFPNGGAKPQLRLFRSDDAGQTWVRRDAGIGGASIAALASDHSDPDLLFAATETGLYRSLDAGMTWALVPGFAGAVTTVETSPFGVYAFLSGFGVQHSIDGGKTWSPARRGLFPHPVSGLTVDPTDPHRLYAGTLTHGAFTYTEP
jgi:photosystem II stability/assembly factor-like uncharacterized protein